MIWIRWSARICVFFFFLLKDAMSVVNEHGVKLTIEPKTVERFQTATLRCAYDIDESTLYAVKWYRGLYEFYRFVPKESPKTKVFPYTGIVVDEHKSNSTQVVLRDIDFNLAGNFTCEITKDLTFATLSDTQKMTVVKLPEFPPTISVEGEPLDCGHTLRANCTSQPARPPARLTFLLNDIVVARSDPLTFRQTQEMAWSDLSLEIILSDIHFSNGRLILQCQAKIDDIYEENARLELNTVKSPVHERVSAMDSSAEIGDKKFVLRFFTIVLILKVLS
ncbi:uncharacterized protein LOC123319331 [Coccinella septempunctata]|uniref:uncharacterized protein LOC123319331 n=1 Tax=Coccinella septempunctata TaxID=41139 RepID=UPI001D091FFD|nr:uncharacterized protein LOC123319331 [Coccinella septempunctata]